MNPIFFQNQQDFREWLILNHESETELYVGYYKVKSNKLSMTWSQSVDEALCFGWIDGIRNSIDGESYQIRFTPRRKNSHWSTVNLNKIKHLQMNNLLYPAGIKIYESRNETKSKVYAFEQLHLAFNDTYLHIFKQHEKAWLYFEALAPSYRKNSIHWVMSAKLEKTREKRLQELISDSEKNTNRWKDNKYKKK